MLVIDSAKPWAWHPTTGGPTAHYFRTRSVPHRRRPLLADQLEAPEAGQVERADQLVVAATGQRPRHRLAADRRRLEAPRPPAGVEVEAGYGRRAHDGREVRRHIRQP